VAAGEAPRLALAALFHEVVETLAAEMRPFLRDSHVDTLREVALANLTRMLRRPSADDARKFSEVEHSAGFGVGSYLPIVAPPPRRGDPAAIVDGLRSSLWPQGFLAGVDPATRVALRQFRSINRMLKRDA
jgi:hypothetical protein